ncbi:hypothetical protein PLEOSDRAFT_171483 [Pleurotus ostreatus PC15]|uniref:Uncharacterized protein n=1 Tax=Pleurotus ostreatus (strain PC15) TaxID=1137138 RepID=A0A067N5H8_PLEO1|nr:hypothetical protein PLEOSDRAFT_171483 [Pleurotus ostreatus PC15]
MYPTAVTLTGPVDDRTEDEGMGYDTDPEMPGLIPVDDDNSDDEGESGVPIPEDVGNTFQRYFDDWDDNNGNGSGILASGMESPEAEDGAQIDPQSIYVMNWGLFASEMLAEQTVTADPFEDVDGELVMTPEVDIKEWANMSPTQWNERTHWEWYSAYYFPGGRMGDSVANAQTMYMETVKELGFPGDDKFAPVNKWEPRFTFWSISSQDYVLRDSLRKGEIVLVNKELLQAEEFNLAWWYAKYLADVNGIDHAERCVSLMEWQPFVVDALDENVFAHLGAMEIRAALTEGREAFVKDNGRWWLDFNDAPRVED